MRIALESSSIRRSPSGVGHYARSLLGALAEVHPRDRFLALSHRGLPPDLPPNVEEVRGWKLPIKELWLQLVVPGMVARARPDLCHFTNSVAPLRLQAPYVVTVHDLGLVRHPEWHPASRRLWMRRILARSILGARAVVCDSEATRRDLIDWLPLGGKLVRVAPLGARPPFFERCDGAARERVRARYDLSKRFVLYVGNIEPRKNLAVAIEAFREAAPADCELVVAGRLAWLWRPIARALEPLAAEGRGRLLGYVPEEDLPALYQSAFAFVYPSRLEGFGLPVLEAMASGTPVVASRIEPLASLVGGGGLLAPPDDAAAWRDALSEVFRDERRRLELGRRARERAAEFTWERTARATMALYVAALAADSTEPAAVGARDRVPR